MSQAALMPEELIPVVIRRHRYVGYAPEEEDLERTDFRKSSSFYTFKRGYFLNKYHIIDDCSGENREVLQRQKRLVVQLFPLFFSHGLTKQ